MILASRLLVRLFVSDLQQGTITSARIQQLKSDHWVIRRIS
ncbi:MAG TPA: hypothetical protein VGJ57_12345 [Nitrospirales bacterium]|jgi:hypothetical protein